MVSFSLFDVLTFSFVFTLAEMGVVGVILALAPALECSLLLWQAPTTRATLAGKGLFHPISYSPSLREAKIET